MENRLVLGGMLLSVAANGTSSCPQPCVTGLTLQDDRRWSLARERTLLSSVSHRARS